MNPLKTKRIHIWPTTKGDLRPRYYLSDENLAGMLPAKDLGIELYGYPMPDPYEFRNVSVTNGDRTDFISIGEGTGGVIQEWRVKQGSLDIQLLNHAGMCGRSMQQTIFVGDDTGIIANPTWAGSQYGNYVPGPQPTSIPPKNYSQNTFVAGARMLSMSVEPGDGQAYIETWGIPVDWDPSGEWFGQPQEGSMFDAIEYSNIRFGYQINVNYQCRPGLDRIKSIAWILDEIPIDLGVGWVPHEFYARFGFDEIFPYNGQNEKCIGLRDTEIEPGVDAADFTNRAEYIGFSDQLTITGSVLPHNDPRGKYKKPGILGKGSNAIIYRALEGSSNSWSFKKDICMGWYSTEVTDRAGNVALRWLNPRGTPEPTSGVLDYPCMVASDRFTWDPGVKKPRGLLESTAYLLIGSWKEVKEMIKRLDLDA